MSPPVLPRRKVERFVPVRILLRKIGGERVQIKYFISSLRSCQTIEDAVLGVPSLIRFFLRTKEKSCQYCLYLTLLLSIIMSTSTTRGQRLAGLTGGDSESVGIGLNTPPTTLTFVTTRSRTTASSRVQTSPPLASEQSTPLDPHYPQLSSRGLPKREYIDMLNVLRKRFNLAAAPFTDEEERGTRQASNSER